jgi:hypothetical protein
MNNTQPIPNAWLLSYITSHHITTNRYQIDLYLLGAGYDPAEIENAWQAFHQKPVPLSKPKFKITRKLKLALKLLLVVELFSLFFQTLDQVWDWPLFYTYPSFLTPIFNFKEVNELVNTIEQAYIIEHNSLYSKDSSHFGEVFLNDPSFSLSEGQRYYVRQDETLKIAIKSWGYLDYKLAPFHQASSSANSQPVPQTQQPNRSYEHFRVWGDRAEVVYRGSNGCPTRYTLAFLRTSTGWKIVGERAERLSEQCG